MKFIKVMKILLLDLNIILFMFDFIISGFNKLFFNLEKSLISK